MVNRLQEREISLDVLKRALEAEPVAGTAPDTMAYREKGGVTAIVNKTMGNIITVWHE
jgi:hypothetical protein